VTCRLLRFVYSTYFVASVFFLERERERTCSGNGAAGRPAVRHWQSRRDAAACSQSISVLQSITAGCPSPVDDRTRRNPSTASETSRRSSTARVKGRIAAAICRLYWPARQTFPVLHNGWLGSRVVGVLDSGAEGPGFRSQSRRCRVTVLGKLFTPIVPLFTKRQNW